ncbi:hypothetical protein [Enorma massiliensis]|uniref:hypothetical protein n=1 Tax=Enorma massiliensis TaxID=1472761 RepID=UPI003AEF6E1B
MNLMDRLPLTRLKLDVALREHRLDEELDDRGVRLRLLAIERELERQDRRIEALTRSHYQNHNLRRRDG